MRLRNLLTLSVPALLLAATASAQPRIISFGNGGTPLGVNSDGTIAGGTAGSSVVKWDVGAMTVGQSDLTGSTSLTAIADNGLFFVGVTPNQAGLGGFPTNANITSVWSTAAPSWVDLPPLLPDAAGGITGSRNSSGLHSPRDISADGTWVVGQANTAPAGFAAFVWDSVSNTSRVLLTDINPSTSRYQDGRALGVSADGSVIVGGQQPNTGSGRAIVWRFNTTTMQYDRTFLDRGTNPTTMQPYGSTVDNMHINAAGTKILGTSFEFNVTTMQLDSWLTRWDWNAGTMMWDRVLLSNTADAATLSSWQNDPSCPIPPQFIPTGMSDDGNTATGILVYSTCGSFIRGGFLWINDGMGGTMYDLYDYLVAQSTPGITDFGPLDPMATIFNPPQLGWANALSSDGQNLVGYGGPQSAFGPGWVVNLGGGGCVPPFFTAQPADDTFSNCNLLQMTVGAGGSAPLVYQWFKDGMPLANGVSATGSTVVGADTRLIRVNNAKPGDAGMYTVQVTGACGAPGVSSIAMVTLDPTVTIAPNDTCATAVGVSEGVNVLGTGQAPCGAFEDDALTSSCEVSSKDLWYVWTPSATGAFRLETCGSNIDTILSLYDGCNGGELACNDDHQVGPSSGCSSTRSRIASFNATMGVPVYIRIGAFGTGTLSSTANVNLSIFAAPTAPANDECSNAAMAAVGANAFDSTEATNDWFGTCSSVLGRDVWFVFNAPLNGDLTVSTCPGTTLNTVLSIHDGCFGNELACNDNFSGIVGCSSTQARIENLAVTAGSNTYIRVTGNSLTAFGAGTLNVTFNADCPGDFDDNGSVDLLDLLAFNAAWSMNLGTSVVAGTNGDYNESGTVDLLDLLAFNADWSSALGSACP